ncbi:MAG: LPXTG cell wall anchor domain-containing protein, partial [Euryarchaeota archaeon]|nr:LPXTG cell wall anchor domain-containing protein [Euryarchaeota archaeon]
MEQQSIIAVIGAIGLVLLALSWHYRKSKNPLL